MHVRDKERQGGSVASPTYNLHGSSSFTHGSQFSTHCMRFQHSMFLYVTTQVSYVVIRHVLLLKIPRDGLERVKTVSRPFVCRCLRHTSVCERKKLWSRPDQTGAKRRFHSKQRNVGNQSEEKRKVSVRLSSRISITKRVPVSRVRFESARSGFDFSADARCAKKRLSSRDRSRE